MLKHTGVSIDLIDDQEMSDMLQNNIRGGLCYINTRSAGIEGFCSWKQRLNRNKWSMVMLDANNLYGKGTQLTKKARKFIVLISSTILLIVSAMTLPLPLRDFRWLSEEEVAAFNPLTDISDDPGPGYILEVDLSYPKQLHQNHASFPLAPENILITDAMLSPYSKSALKACYKKTKHSARKLTSTFNDRKNYVVHGSNLKFYLQQGLKLDKIHRVMTFHQECFIEPYISYCTMMRKNAKTETEKTFWKLVINALYGKLIEGLGKRMDCRFNRNREQAMRNVASPLYKGSIICDDGKK